MNLNLKDAAADEAASRYLRNAVQILNMQNSIRQNRRGSIQLTEIPQDAERLRKRLDRERLPRDKAFERINGIANFQDVCIVKKIMRMGDAVCRLSMHVDFGGTSFATGFLVAPGIIITNHHVFSTPEEAANGRAEFFYELNEQGIPSRSALFNLRPDLFFLTSEVVKQSDIAFSGLDFTLVAIESTSVEGKSASELSHVRLDGGLGKILEGENCIVVQHPAGDYKKVVLKDIRLMTLTDDFLIYESDTLPGSSGSMVIGLGTGEIVGLHHSGVPRKNEHGDWLRKDGTVAMDTDPDDLIDWIGNEGIRVSSLTKAISAMPYPPNMESYRNILLSAMVLPKQINIVNPKPIEKMEATTPFPVIQDTKPTALQQFEVIVTDKALLAQNWSETKEDLIPGLQSAIRVFPLSTDPELKSHYYITVASDSNPWVLAAQIQNLPHIESCIPDRAVPTYAEPSSGERSAGESAISSPEESDEKNWKRFDTKWKDAKWYIEALKTGKPNYTRQWNWSAVDAADFTISPDLLANLKKLKLVQLDTGYSDHTKNAGGYDFTSDYDTIDKDEDALDTMSQGVLRQPGHGTRTASLVIGTRLAHDPKNCNGNQGLLTKDGRPAIQLWPYRISKSVVLLGSVRNMVEGASRAVDAGADIMFMCMGIYPRPVIDAVARYAYDHGVIWICAAGNYVKVVVAPALCPGTIAVAAINPNNDPWDQSSYGPEVDIAAPGEDVYVPVKDLNGVESMRYGSGTSYATPHVAAAAMLWKAKHGTMLKQYTKPWQVVEAFRYCLTKSANKDVPWIDHAGEKVYGDGLLDIPGLLACNLPPVEKLVYAYTGKSTKPGWDLGVIEAVESIWNAIERNVWGREEAAVVAGLTPRGKQALEALSGVTQGPATEAMATAIPDSTRERILHEYFKSYTINQ